MPLYMSSSVNNSRRIIVRFTNRKFAKKVLLKKSKLRKIPSTSRSYNIFINENLTLRNIKVAFLCFSSPDIHRGKVLKICHLNDLFNLFSNHDFGENIREDNKMIPYSLVTNHFLGKLD